MSRVDASTTASLMVVARHVLSMLAQDADEMWGDYPEIGERDWNEVSRMVLQMTVPPNKQLYEQAYAHLESRAEGEV